MIKNKEQELKEVNAMKKQALTSKKVNDVYEKGKTWKRKDNKTIILIK